MVPTANGPAAVIVTGVFIHACAGIVIAEGGGEVTVTEAVAGKELQPAVVTTKLAV